MHEGIRYEEFLLSYIAAVQPLPGTGRSSYAKKRRVKRMGSDYYSFARWKTKGNYPSIEITSKNRDHSRVCLIG